MYLDATAVSEDYESFQTGLVSELIWSVISNKQLWPCAVDNIPGGMRINIYSPHIWNWWQTKGRIPPKYNLVTMRFIGATYWSSIIQRQLHYQKPTLAWVDNLQVALQPRASFPGILTGSLVLPGSLTDLPLLGSSVGPRVSLSNSYSLLCMGREGPSEPGQFQGLPETTELFTSWA